MRRESKRVTIKKKISETLKHKERQQEGETHTHTKSHKTEQNGNSKSFHTSNYFKCLWIKCTN